MLHRLPLAHPNPSPSPAGKPRFVDVTTGMRLRYLEWPGGGGADVVLLLHGIAECADVWEEVAAHLADRGYRVLALDLRGHGGSSRAAGGRSYRAALLADDVAAFIVAKDLYVRPVAVVGCGMGAVVGLTLAAAAPRLVGALAVVEFGLPPAVVAAAAALRPPCCAYQPAERSQAAAVAAPCGKDVSARTWSSAEALPWWSFWVGQGADFASAAECAAFLGSPLPNLGPLSLLPVCQAAATAAHVGHGATPAQQEQRPSLLREVLAGLGRPPAGAARAAACVLQLQAPANAWQDGFPAGDGDDALPLRMDPQFFFDFDLAGLVAGVASLECPLLVAHGTRSAWAPAAHAAALARAASAAASVTVEALPRGGHHPATDGPQELVQRVAAFLEGPAVRCFDAPPAGGAGGRRPEAMGLRPLPQYATVEEARRALGPRRVPTAAEVEGELRRLRLAAGRPAGEAGDDEGGGGGGAGEREYFAFVG
jgi:pimeloyl-ACP methyl ester carboxylesterase